MLLLGGFLRLLFFHVLGGSDCAYNEGKEEQVEGFYPDTCQNCEQSRNLAPRPPEEGGAGSENDNAAKYSGNDSFNLFHFDERGCNDWVNVFRVNSASHSEKP